MPNETPQQPNEDVIDEILEDESVEAKESDADFDAEEQNAKEEK